MHSGPVAVHLGKVREACDVLAYDGSFDTARSNFGASEQLRYTPVNVQLLLRARISTHLQPRPDAATHCAVVTESSPQR